MKPITGRIDVKNNRCLARFFTPMDPNKDDPYEFEPIKYRCKKARKNMYEDFGEDEGK
jgi:hypothetical protein